MKRIEYLILVMLVILAISLLIFSPSPPVEGFTAATAPFRRRYSSHGIRIDRKNKTITDGRKVLYYPRSFNSREGIANCRDKLRTCEVLAAAGLPVARHYKWDHRAGDAFNLREIEEKVGYPLVVKPRSNHKGHNVFVGIEDSEELLQKVRRLGRRKVIIEKEMKGEEYRVNVLGGEVIGIVKRSPPSVLGDGKSTIRELVNNSVSNRKYKIHTVDESLLRRVGKSMKTIPAEGEIVVVSKVSNYHNGGGLQHVSIESVHKDNLEMFEKVAGALRVTNVGFDYFVSAPLSTHYRLASAAAVIDANSAPDAGFPYDAIPTRAKKREWIDNILRILFKGEKTDRYL